MSLASGSGSRLRLGPRLDRGGQGEVFEVVGHRDVVIKRYWAQELRKDPTLPERLKLMVANRPPGWREHGSGRVLLTWPTDIVADDGTFIGYLMPRIDGRGIVRMLRLADPSDRDAATGDLAWVRAFTWRSLVDTAVSLAGAVEALHATDVVIGDFNDANVAVTPEAGVTLFDCDSMQISDPATGRRFLCRVGRPDFTAPELVGVDLKTTVRPRSSDLFALAVHLHQLLLEGEHPFRGRWRGRGDPPMEAVAARRGLWTHGGGTDIGPRPSAIGVDLLPLDMIAMFRRAFVDGASRPSLRPGAGEWRRALCDLHHQLSVCRANPAHNYPAFHPCCPWCAHEATRPARISVTAAVPSPAKLPSRAPAGGVARTSPSLRPRPAVPPRPRPTIATGISKLRRVPRRWLHWGLVGALAVAATGAGIIFRGRGHTSLSVPTGVAVAADGRLYVADPDRARVFEVSPNGAMKMFAGTGRYTFGGDAGPAAAAALSLPSGVAVAGDGSVYIADSYNGRIRRVSPTGIITTVAGDGQRGFAGDNGPATAAALDRPSGVAVAGDGSVYIADQGNGRIRRVSPTGIITTVAGSDRADPSGDNGPATSAGLRGPESVAVAGDGSFYIADYDDNRVRRVSPTGIITTVAGDGQAAFRGDNGRAGDAELDRPSGVAVAGDGSVYIADQGNGRIRRVSRPGIITTVAGSDKVDFGGDHGPATSAALLLPSAVAVAGDGSLYVADQGNARIRRISPTGIITTVARG